MKLSRYQPNQKKLMQDCRYLFEIIDNPEQRKGRKGGEYYIFKLAINFEDSSSRKFNQIIAPWEVRYGNLLLALGGKQEDKGAVDLDDIDLVGAEFEDNIVHVKDRKDPLTIRERLVNFTSVRAFAKPDNEEMY